MKFQITTLLSAVALCGTLFNSGAVMAQGTWDFGGASCNASGAPSVAANCAVGTVTATMSAWGYTTAGTGFVQGNLGEFDPNGFGAYTGKFETSAGSQHGFDNLTTGCGITTLTGNAGLSAGNSGCGGNVEAMLMSFSTRVSLSQVKIGFYTGDADISVYRWDGALGGPTMTSTTATLGSGTLSAGWTLISSNDMDLVNPFNTGNTGYSSQFLITTYFGAAATNLNSGNDAFKILNITADKCTGTLSTANNGASCTPPTGTPEPGSLALAGLALFGVVASRRKVTAALKTA